MRGRNLIASCFITLILSQSINFVHASDSKKWGKVERDFMKMESYSKDTSAAAVKLYDIGELRIEARITKFELSIKRHYQTKILKESGKSFSDISLTYWHEDKVKNLKAQTIQPNGKKIKLNKKNIFDEEEKEKYRVKKFTMPDVQVGSIIEVEYEIKSNYIYSLEPWIFQSSIPTIESAVTLELYRGLTYNYKTNYDPLGRVKYIKDEYFDSFRNEYLPRHKFFAKDLPAVKKEPYISTLKNYRARVDFQITGYLDRSFIKSIPTLSNELLDGKFGSFLKPKGETKKLVTELTAGVTSAEKKLRRLYEYVRDEFEDEDYSSIYPRKEQKEILKQKKASESERNLLLISMALASGLEAKPLLISTRSHGWVEQFLPFLRQYNRTLALVTVDSKKFIMDASDRFTPFGYLTPGSFVKVGLKIEKDGGGFIKIANNTLQGKEKCYLKVEIDEEGLLKGVANLQSTGYLSRYRNRQLDNEEKTIDFFEEKLASNLDGVEIVTADTTIKAAAIDTFATQFDFELEDFAESVDDEMFFRPALFNRLDENPFVSEKREFPIEYGYCFRDDETIEFRIPEGFKVVEIPQRVYLKNEYFIYDRIISKSFAEPSKLQYRRSFTILKHFIPAKEYSMIKTKFAKIVDADQAQVVLKASE